MEQIQVPIVLSVAHINVILSALGKQPYSDVAEVIGIIKTQGDAAVNDARAKMAAALTPSEPPKGD